jgi:hypothetical protein
MQISKPQPNYRGDNEIIAISRHHALQVPGTGAPYPADDDDDDDPVAASVKC